LATAKQQQGGGFMAKGGGSVAKGGGIY